MVRTCLLLVAVLLLSASGDVDNGQASIVGGWPLASDDELSQENVVLWFRKENGTYYPGTLSYHIATDGTLLIEKGHDHAACCFGGIDKHLVDNYRVMRFPASDLARVRRMLARLRPMNLSKDVPFALPPGCGFVMDSRPWNGVTYSRGKLGGAFVFHHQCEGAGADQARALLRSVVQSLPSVEGSAEFLTGD